MEPRPREELRRDPAHLLLLLVAAISVALLVLVFPSPSRQDPWDAVNVIVVAAAVLLGLLSSGGKSSAVDEDDRGKKKKSIGLADNRRVNNVPGDHPDASTSRSSPPPEILANLAVAPSPQRRTVNVVGERVEPMNKAGSKQSSMPVPAAYNEQQQSYREKKAVDYQEEQYYTDDSVTPESANKAGSKQSVLPADIDNQQQSHLEKKVADRRDGRYYKDDSVTLESGIKAGSERSVLPANATNEQQQLYREKKVANHRDGQYFKDDSIRLESAIKARSDRFTLPSPTTEERQRLHREKKVANRPDGQYKDDSVRSKSVNKARPERSTNDDERQRLHREKKLVERQDAGQLYKDDSSNIKASTGFDTDAYYNSSIRPTRRRHRRSASLDWPDPPPSVPLQKPIIRSGSTPKIFGSDSLFTSTLPTRKAHRLEVLPSLHHLEDAKEEKEEGLSNSLADLGNNSNPATAEILQKENKKDHQPMPIKLASPLASPSSPDTDGSVNRKAGDFIDWFREQLRLQKLESLEREKKKEMVEKGV